MIMKVIHLIIFLAIVGKIDARMKRALGGLPILIQQAPFFVSIRSNDQHQCGGALTTDRTILTARRCSRFPNMTMVTGADGNNPNGVVNTVFDRFDGIEPVMIPFPYNIIPNARQNPINGGVADVLMYQPAEFIYFQPENGPHGRGQLFRVQVTLHITEACARVPGYLCASQRAGTHIGITDIGGPLIQNGRLIGIASHPFAPDSQYIMFLNVVTYWRQVIAEDAPLHSRSSA